jgi:hypothetical protein
VTKDQLIEALKPFTAHCDKYGFNVGEQFYILCKAFDHDPVDILTELGFEYSDKYNCGEIGRIAKNV